MSALTASEICKNLESLFNEAMTDLKSAKDTSSLEALRVRYLGKKSVFSEALSQMKNLSPDDRKQVGEVANRLRTSLQDQILNQKQSLERKELDQKLSNDRLDVSLPGVHFDQGFRHPLSITMNEAVSILELAGLTPVYGPEVEYEDFNFDRMNFKKAHPARDMQATFFAKPVEENRPLVLRTHTSPVQVRVLMKAAKESLTLPIRIQAPGRVYRVDDDATHAPMFHQIEGLVVDRSSGMGELRAVLDFFFRKFFDRDDLKVRFRPSFFPFTEPSAEVDISCFFCETNSCKVCKGSGWLEVAGAGLVHPEVFKACGWNPDDVQGWAFGMGVERLAMLKMGVSDLRSFLENKMSFLRGGRA